LAGVAGRRRPAPRGVPPDEGAALPPLPSLADVRRRAPGRRLPAVRGLRDAIEALDLGKDQGAGKDELGPATGRSHAVLAERGGLDGGGRELSPKVLVSRVVGRGTGQLSRVARPVLIILKGKAVLRRLPEPLGKNVARGASCV